MPAGLVARTRADIQNAYTAGRLRSLFDRRRKTPEEREAERQAQLDRELADERRAMAELDRRQQATAALAETREQLAAMRAAIQADPHDRYRRWLGRTNTSYDAATYRAAAVGGRGERLVKASRDRSRSRVDWADVLDTDMDELGEDPTTFLRNVERVQQQRDRLARLRAQFHAEQEAEKRRRQTYIGRIPRYLRELYA